MTHTTSTVIHRCDSRNTGSQSNYDCVIHSCGFKAIMQYAVDIKLSFEGIQESYDF